MITNISGVSKTFTVSVTDTASDGVQLRHQRRDRHAGRRGIGDVQGLGRRDQGRRGRAQAGDPARVGPAATEVAHAMLYVLVGEGERAPGRHMLPPPKA